jgi:hypothetical protein
LVVGEVVGRDVAGRRGDKYRLKILPRTGDCKSLPSASIAEYRCIETNPTKSAEIKYEINLAVNSMCSTKGSCSGIAVEVKMQDIESE